MKNTARLLLLSLACAGLTACASNKTASQPAAPAQPDMQAMMENWTKAMTPGPQHAHLAKSVGTWEGTVKMWMDPSMPPSESKCTTVITSVMGGRYIQGTTNGMMNMGEASAPFEGMGLYGFDNVQKKYQAVWIDNMGTGMMTGVGDLSANGKVLIWTMTMADPMTGQVITSREVDTQIDANTQVMEMFVVGPDGKEFRTMEIRYSRKK